MTFNIQVKLNNKKEVFSSGGRFDSLIKDLGNKKNLNGVGAAINRSIYDKRHNYNFNPK